MATSIYGGQEVKFGGAMNMETGLSFVFLSAKNFSISVDPATGMALSSGQVDDNDIVQAATGTNPTGTQSIGIVPGTTLNGTKGISGLVIQQLDFRADRPLSTFYDISSACVYYVAGRSTVMMGLNRIVGPRGLIVDYYTEFGSPCLAPYNHMFFDISKAACGANGVAVPSQNSKLLVKNCVLTQIAMSVSVQNFVITETGQVQGSQLAYM
jgi:hypothetical protein